MKTAIIAPITDWKPYFAPNIWHVRIDPDDRNGLTKVFAVDALQLRAVDTQRFIRKLGQLANTTIEEIAIAIAAVIEYHQSTNAQYGFQGST